MAWFMYINFQSIQDSIQDSKEVTHFNKVVHMKFFTSITCTAQNIRPNLFKTVFIYELKHILHFHFHLFQLLKSVPTYWAEVPVYICTRYYYLSCVLTTGFILGYKCQTISYYLYTFNLHSLFPHLSVIFHILKDEFINE